MDKQDTRTPEPVDQDQQTTPTASTSYDSPQLESTPTIVPTAPHPPTKRARSPRRVMLFLLILIPIVIAGVLGPYLIFNRNNLATVLPIINPGSFTQAPLTPDQIQKLQNRADRLTYKQLAALYVQRMTLDEKIGQMMMIEYDGPNYSQDLDTMLHDLHAGGVIMYQFREQLRSLEQVRTNVTRMQERATFPLLISVDEEGWNVHRLTDIYPPRKSARDIRDSRSTAVAADEGQKVARDMLALGLNMNLAPDVDVSSDDNGYIGWDQRAFGENPEDVIKYASPYLKAMQQNGVVGCLKHFPGIGAIPKGQNNDPHYFLTTLERTREQLDKVDLAPFKYFINSQGKWEKPACIMPSDVLIPSIDPKYPAELSPAFMTKILREEMGYDGVSLTDALSMGGVEIDGQKLTIDHAVVLALKAGNDMTLGVGSTKAMQSVITAIKTALNDGTLTQQRLDEATTRVIALKMERGLVSTTIQHN